MPYSRPASMRRQGSTAAIHQVVSVLTYISHTSIYGTDIDERSDEHGSAGQVEAVRARCGRTSGTASRPGWCWPAQEYAAGIDDVWDALTNPERLPRWFLPVTGDLPSAGATSSRATPVVRCWPATSRSARWLTWEFGGEVSWLELPSDRSRRRTRLELEHVAPGRPAIRVRAGRGRRRLGSVVPRAGQPPGRWSRRHGREADGPDRHAGGSGIRRAPAATAGRMPNIAAGDGARRSPGRAATRTTAFYTGVRDGRAPVRGPGRSGRRRILETLGPGEVSAGGSARW